MTRKLMSAKLGMGCAALFAIPFAGLGVVTFYFFVSTLAASARRSDGVEVPAVITHAELKASRIRRSTAYDAVARYRYEIGGKRYDGDCVSLCRGPGVGAAEPLRRGLLQEGSTANGAQWAVHAAKGLFPIEEPHDARATVLRGPGHRRLAVRKDDRTVVVAVLVQVLHHRHEARPPSSLDVDRSMGTLQRGWRTFDLGVELHDVNRLHPELEESVDHEEQEA